MTSNNLYIGSEEAADASACFNSLPVEERTKLAPLLELHRQQGLAEAHTQISDVASAIKTRIERIRA